MVSQFAREVFGLLTAQGAADNREKELALDRVAMAGPPA